MKDALARGVLLFLFGMGRISLRTVVTKGILERGVLLWPVQATEYSLIGLPAYPPLLRSADDDGVDEPNARAAIELLLEDLALVEKLGAHDARLNPHVKDVFVEP